LPKANNAGATNACVRVGAKAKAKGPIANKGLTIAIVKPQRKGKFFCYGALEGLAKANAVLLGIAVNV